MNVNVCDSRSAGSYSLKPLVSVFQRVYVLNLKVTVHATFILPHPPSVFGL